MPDRYDFCGANFSTNSLFSRTFAFDEFLIGCFNCFFFLNETIGVFSFFYEWYFRKLFFERLKINIEFCDQAKVRRIIRTIGNVGGDLRLFSFVGGLKFCLAPTYISVVRLRPVRASGPPRVIQSLLVFAAFRHRSGLLRHRAATSCFGSSALPTSVLLLLLLLGSPPVRFPTLRLGYSDREPSRGQRAISRLGQIDHHSAPAHWRVLVRHPAKTRRNLVLKRENILDRGTKNRSIAYVKKIQFLKQE